MTLEKKTHAERFVPDLVVEKSKTAQEGYSLAQDFFNKINTEYPGLGYPDREAMDPFNPDRTERRVQRTAITYAARVNDVVVGILTGEETMSEEEGEEDLLIFRGQSLLVDPKFQHTNVAPQLMEQAQLDYENMTITPVPLGGKDYSRLHKASRHEALRRFYRKLGFKEHERNNTMSWRKQKKGNI